MSRALLVIAVQDSYQRLPLWRTMSHPDIAAAARAVGLADARMLRRIRTREAAARS
ncbi:hypothetical protein [Saccharopolyspora aridisoli]|uniref:hypothetical protein n=1 Tax=Saccharopolyspora aridisoli TaxID=2530385 RepID=UPI001A9D46E7|nr:hypothetical protein [Saccharopolyspora aridisoli]